MTAKQIVLEKMPKATAQKFWADSTGRKVYTWYIYDDNGRVFASGRIESKAWKAAKQKLGI